MFIEALNSAAAVPHVDLTNILKRHSLFYPVLRKLFFDSAIRAAVVSIGESSDVRDEFLIPEHEVSRIGMSESMSLWERQELLYLGADTGYYLDYRKWDVMVKLLNRAIASSEVISRRGSSAVLGLGPDLVIKVFEISSIEEMKKIKTMRLIKNRLPGFPIPELRGCFRKQCSDRIFLLMSRVSGRPLDSVWESLNETQKASIHNQLISILHDIRSIPHPEHGRHHAVLCRGDPCRCENARGSMHYLLPFLAAAPPNRDLVKVYMLMKFALTQTTGNLDPRKVMIDLSGPEVTVTAILDWDMYELLVTYWEYVDVIKTRFPEADCGDCRLYLLRGIDDPGEEMMLT
ncbi:uncharacterized protein LDX57_002123 [Aspergillus melleus]|uniref:uncharacterized protein n=1 Tax=Aspergillus melleus TaxID=138277 RepID=UPI001E8DD0FE|nr:uncharacterized protein LDX57_002123 [Aspergillus melleus]KAH8424372.1 hypothetical protein LDX57_002123 [Aspergillus melleus]